MTAGPVEILMQEHRVIEKVVAAMDRLAARLDAGDPVDAETVKEIVRFMRLFADQCHHGKEEFRLFPALLEKGLPAEGGPVQVMISEHATGRRLVGELEKAAEAYGASGAAAAGTLGNALRDIAALYTQHIWKEDNILFPLAQRILDAEDTGRLMEAFAAVEKEHGAETHQHFVRFAESLERDTETETVGA